MLHKARYIAYMYTYISVYTEIDKANISISIYIYIYIYISNIEISNMQTLIPWGIDICIALDICISTTTKQYSSRHTLIRHIYIYMYVEIPVY